MNSKKIITATLSLLLCALLVIGTINIVVDPLFQYHKPWFGLKPYIISETYQDPGMAKIFDFDNAVVGNSLTENFMVSDLNDALGGKTIKLTGDGTYVVHWVHIFELLANRTEQPQKILIDLDPYIFTIPSEEPKSESHLPFYLYDNNYLNDVEYLFNFTLTKNYTYQTIKTNIENTIQDYDKVFMWPEEELEPGKEKAIKNFYKHKERGHNQKCLYTEDNLNLLKEYFEKMEDTEFIFFCSPFSVLFWYDIIEEGLFAEYKENYEKTFRFMSQFDNVSIYFWTDADMLNVISDLDNYVDSFHYGPHINKELLLRIKDNYGLLSKEESVWKTELDKYFDYLESFDYTTIFE